MQAKADTGVLASCHSLRSKELESLAFCMGPSSQSMNSRKKSAHTDSSEYKTFTEVSSEPWPAEASEPYIRYYPDPENSDIGKALFVS